ncbi:MAG: sigma-70 family RNA polymerase sigma factor [Tannerellaceae bacterium]|jgi:RNA polymerase sigma-70 factor (ECF subfamily)|nr:sigma-70 family RNA polymerase sigma factor [Tannerellaceae bacterium]
MEEMVTREILGRVAVGDHDAFRVLYDDLYAVAYRFVHYFLGNRSDCEDVTAGVFFIVWQHREGLPEIRDFKTWLYIVCRNEVYHFLRRKEKFPSVSIDDMAVGLHMTADADSGVIEDEMVRAYDDAIARLPERCKLIFLMVREERLKYKDIAAILSVTEGTVEQQMNIAIRRITAVVREYFPTLGVRRRR